jgi:hypothetical protein
MTQDPAGGPTRRPIGLSPIPIILAVVVVGILAYAGIKIFGSHNGTPSQPVAGPTTPSPSSTTPSPTRSPSTSPTPPTPQRLVLIPGAGDAVASNLNPGVNVNMPDIHNPGSVDAQYKIWVTLPDGTHLKFGNPENSCGGSLQSGSLCCIPSVHNSWICNVPAGSDSPMTFGLPGSLQPGTTLYVKLPGRHKLLHWNIHTL